MIDSGSVIAALAALAQEHRLAAFRLLVEAGPDGMPAGQIADQLDIAASSLSFHLSQLERSNLVVRRRAGRSLIYSAHFDAMNALVGYLTDNCCGGAACAPAPTPADAPATSPSPERNAA